MKRVAIIVEVKKREMPFMSILKAALKNKGYIIKLIPFRSLCTWHILFFRPDIVIINGLRHDDPFFIKQVYIPKRLFKSKIACYYSEQVGYYNKSIADDYNNKLINDNVDYHISWGPRFSKDLKNMGIPDEKLWYIGSIQYDIDKYLKKSSEFIKKEIAIKYQIPYEKHWIMYADNIVEEYQPEGLYKVRREDTYMMVEKVAQLNRDCHVIFRHHPDSTLNEIEDACKRFAKIDNVSVISEGHIFDWTCGISALIMWNSTSSLQVMFMGKPVFGFITSDGKNPENYWYKDIFPTYSDSVLLAKDIHNTLHGVAVEHNQEIDKNKEKYISDWYFKKDGLSFERMCYLIDIISKDTYKPLQNVINYSVFKYIKILYSELISWFGDIVKNRSKERDVTKKDVEVELQKYDISRFSEKSFTIEKSEIGHFLV